MAARHRKRYREQLRLRLFIRQFGLCYWCGSPMSLMHRHRTANANVYATLDHVIRRADGGTLSLENTVAAHGKCNSGRHGHEAGYDDHRRAMVKKFDMLARELEFTTDGQQATEE